MELNNGFSDVDYVAFGQKIFTSIGIRLAEYKPDQMRRRIAMIAKQMGCTSFLAYYVTISKDNALMKAFLDHITINVTEMMRNDDLFRDLATSVLPELVASRKGLNLSIWSAGCSYGAEAYTVAMLLNEMSSVPTYSIRGTDLDMSILSRANSATFHKLDMGKVPPALRQKYFMELDANTYMPVPNLRRNISFTQHDLLGEDYPIETYDLILCRNVTIYFTDEAKDRINAKFQRALRPNGVLFVGGTERISDAEAMGFKSIRPFFYRAEKKSTAPALKLAA